ncbi:metallophosphoesterase [Pseudoduganella umbonata]|uniref:Putative MPP superfamily phosphohydrolase n=1 Tax=Pseudoduganella umbonata TaxID=864828 RepID=A0A4P8HXF8_9BURK|nr:metallophosphoesterase [Pseudoduganella umbonata]MBB3223468.1 putative MPP superfamily phosphohydrolase [Pseudoduganella umbonata]QCP13642.1 hypothetical protein FCL38_26800 [Pseudoduganella umbonata]
MPPTIRWLHLSDFHVGKDAYEQRRLFTEIIREIERWKNEKEFVPDYVFLTGDIANKGQKREYESFRKDFLIPLQEKFDVSTIVFPVPGNHDVERPGTDTLDSTAPLAASSKFFDADKIGKAARDQIVPRFKNYKKLMAASGISPDWLAKSEGTAFHIRSLAGVQVAVIGLNTAWLCKNDQDKNKLTPGYRLVESALKKAEGCQIKIILGHHPLSWWNENEEANIRRLFAQHNVIYLHGHMHKSEGRVEESMADHFLTLQAGAAFQAREGEPWINGFSWGDLDPQAGEVRISPRYWVNGEWPPDMSAITQKRRIGETDWWRFSLPGMRAPLLSNISVQIPGWKVLDAEILNSFAREIDQQEAQRFFDGAEPDWALAISPQFPLRCQTKALLRKVTSFKGEDRPQISLLHGPAAEGKSMALRQIVVAVVRANPDIGVFWHQDDSVSLNVQAFEKMLATKPNWLIATDHGDMIVDDLARLAQSLKRAGNCNVQFVIAAHDSDWKLAKGDTIVWNSFSRFESTRLAGLTEEDATSLAEAWLHFGASSNDSSLHGLKPDALAQRLIHAAKDDGFDEGAFFGALLTLRHGKDLRSHMRALLQRFDNMTLPSGGTVGGAFRLISAMHAEGLNFLSTNVLQESIGCDRLTMQQDVLWPLAAEAAASGGAYLRTRHRRIAKAALEVCSDDGEDLESLYILLACSAVRLRSIKNVRLQELEDWNYTLTKHFVQNGHAEMAVRIAEKMLEVVPDNVYYAVNLARLKRESGDLDGAFDVLYLMSLKKRDNRAVWLEWGTICGILNDYVSNVGLTAYSISDDLSPSTLGGEDASLAFANLAKAFEELNRLYRRDDFNRARAGCAFLGLLLSQNKKNLSFLRIHQQESISWGTPVDVTEGLAWMQAGLNAAIVEGSLNDSVAERIGNPAQFRFAALRRLLGQ